MSKRWKLSPFFAAMGLAASAQALPVSFNYTQTDATTGSGTVSLLTPITVTSIAGQQTLSSVAAQPSAVVTQKDATAAVLPAGIVGFVSVVNGLAPTAGSPDGFHLNWSGSSNIVINDGIGNTFGVNVPHVIASGTPFSYAVSLFDDNGAGNDAVSANTGVIAGYVGNNGSGHRHTQANQQYVAGPDNLVATFSGNLGGDANGDNLGIGVVLRQSVGGATLFADQVTITARLESTALQLNGGALTQFNAAAGTTLIDIGAAGQRVEPGAIQLTGPANNTNGSNLTNPIFVSTNSGVFSVALDNVSQTGTAVGGLDWRDRGDSANGAQSLVRIGEDLVKNNSGIIRLTLGNLAAGSYEMTSYHRDLFDDQTDEIHIFVDEGAGYFERLVFGETTTGADISVDALSTALIQSSAATFSFTSDGINPVRIVFDGRFGNSFNQAALSGFSIRVAPVPEPASISLLAVSAMALLRRRRAA